MIGASRDSFVTSGISLTFAPGGVLGGLLLGEPLFSLFSLAMAIIAYLQCRLFWNQVFTNLALRSDLKKLIIGNVLLSFVFLGYFWFLLLIPYGYIFFHFMQDATHERITSHIKKQD